MLAVSGCVSKEALPSQADACLVPLQDQGPLHDLCLRAALRRLGARAASARHPVRSNLPSTDCSAPQPVIELHVKLHLAARAWCTP